MRPADPALLNERYRLGRMLGGGTLATVTHAFDVVLGRDVAIKMLVPAFAQDEQIVRRFYGEARAAASLVDPHIVAVYDVVSEPALAIVMEYVDGPSLAELLKRDGPVGETRAIGYARQIAKALAAAHAQAIIHRDIKPANVLVGRGDVLKVADFGIAKVTAARDPALTEPGRLVGSAQYFSPEQAQGLPLSPASDLYSLGVVVYELVTGTVPFPSGSPVSSAVAHVMTPAPTPAELERTMSPGLAAIVHRLLRKDPAERFASALDLDAALASVEVPAPSDPAGWDAPTIVGTEAVVAVPRRTRRASAWRAAAAAQARAAVAATSAAATAALRSPRPQLAIALTVLLVLLAVGWIARPRAAALADVRHAPLARARSTLSGLGFVPVVSTQASMTEPAGKVIAERPDPGTKLDRGATVRLVVSSGVPLVAVPDLQGLDLAGAQRAMQRANLRATYAARINDAAPNTVIDQFPVPGTQVRSGSSALVVISTGPQPPVIDTTGDGGPTRVPPGWAKHHHGHHGED